MKRKEEYPKARCVVKIDLAPETMKKIVYLSRVMRISQSAVARFLILVTLIKEGYDEEWKKIRLEEARHGKAARKKHVPARKRTVRPRQSRPRKRAGRKRTKSR